MITLNRKQLYAILHYLNILSELYDVGFGMRPESCVAIEQNGTGWSVFDADRANRYHEKIFNSETEACLNVLERVFEMKSCVDGVSMNIRQLHSILVYLKVPEELYDFSAGYFGTNCYSMEWTAQGWEVFFAVNGEKCDVAVFDSETDACLDLLYKVMHR